MLSFVCLNVSSRRRRDILCHRLGLTPLRPTRGHAQRHTSTKLFYDFLPLLGKDQAPNSLLGAIAREDAENEFCRQRDIKLVRVRQQPLQKISDTDILIPKTTFTKKEMDAIVIRVFFELYHIEFMDMRIQKDFPERATLAR